MRLRTAFRPSYRTIARELEASRQKAADNWGFFEDRYDHFEDRGLPVPSSTIQNITHWQKIHADLQDRVQAAFRMARQEERA